MADGLVNELSAKRRGLFAQDAELTAWDSITAHDKGLAALIRVLSTMRSVTTEAPLHVPYRNGILHGMDLSYDNRAVAVKSWVLLFAVRDLALRIENPKPRDEPRTSWRELAATLADNADNKKRLEIWQRREMVVGADCPATGVKQDYQAGSPEQAVVEFLELWGKRNFGHMAQRLSRLHADYYGKKLTQHVRESYVDKAFSSFLIEAIDDQASAITEMQASIRYIVGADQMNRPFRFRLINEDVKGNPVPRGKPGSAWRLVNWEL